MKCLDVIFIRIIIKGYLKKISENEIVNFECKGIKNKNKDTKKGLALLKKSAEMGFDQARDALNMIAIK